MSTSTIRRIHLLGFVEEVRHIHENMPDRRFCFVLGAGASKTSLIPTAGELGLEWLRKIHTESMGEAGDFTKWLNEGTHGIKALPPKTNITDIAAIAAAYPAIYHAKWGHDRAQGDAEIERHIEAAKPSYGYYALAEILASDDPAPPSRHNVVITPNFDNLPAETLGALGKKIPIVIGHSAITDFARPTMRRPLIIKFHHDFLLAPKSNPNQVDSMEKGYAEALAEIFRLYTPIVIGYGGNDGSLMGLLEKLQEKSIPGGILWCWRTGDQPGSRIEAVVSKQAGTLIEIGGFDELMTLLEKPFGHVFNPDKLSERAAERARELKQAKEQLTKKAESGLSPAATSNVSGERSLVPPITPAASAESSAVLDALRDTVDLSEQTKNQKKAPLPWWHWQNRINAALDLNEQEQLFIQGLDATQNAAPLLGNYASFLQTQRKDDARAEEYYLRALVADPNHAIILGNYANFLRTQRKDDARAEEFYVRALAADPNNAVNLANYALILETQHKDDTQAEEYYLKALAADPNRANTLCNYASFLKRRRNDDARAEEYYVKALTADPNHANSLANYASFLHERRKDTVRAEEYYTKAVAAQPNHATILGNYANFLWNQRKNNAKAEEYYLKALAADPNHASILGNYANFLKNGCKDNARAAEYYLKALAADPNHANTLGNYAQFLIGCGKFAEAVPLAKQAWLLLPSRNDMGIGEILFSLWLLAVVNDADGLPALGRLKTLLKAGYDRYPWNFDAMLTACVPKLPNEQGELARKLASAILDETKLVELDAEPTWKLIQAIPLNAPWPNKQPNIDQPNG